jgi:hypothetical protein
MACWWPQTKHHSSFFCHWTKPAVVIFFAAAKEARWRNNPMKVQKHASDETVRDSKGRW